MHPLPPEPTAREARPGWSAVPGPVVTQLEALFKDKIVSAETGWGGFSPSAVFVVTLSSGNKVFIKGAHPGDDAHGTETVRQEIAAYRLVPGINQTSPRHLGSVGDGGEDGWLLAAFEYIDAIPTLPWTKDKIISVFHLLKGIHAVREIPAEIPQAEKKNYIERFLKAEGGWIRIKNDPAIQEKFISVFQSPEEARAWLKKNIPALVDLQRRASALGGPVGILHQDLRTDNILFGRDNKARLIDWPNFCAGPVALDVAAFLPVVAAESSMPAQELLQEYTRVTGLAPGEENISVALASLSGYMADNLYRAVPPRLPRLRWMQKKACQCMLAWAAELAGIDSFPQFKS